MKLQLHQTILIGLLLVIPGFVIGCFTVLRHPPVKTADYLSPQITHRDACINCHRGYHYYSYDNPYMLHAPYTSLKFSSWLYYYNYPWWLEDRYYPDNYGQTSVSDTLPLDPRHFGRRQGIDAYSPPATPLNLSTPGFQFRKQNQQEEQAAPAPQEQQKPAIQKRRQLDDSTKASSSKEEKSRKRKKKTE